MPDSSRTPLVLLSGLAQPQTSDVAEAFAVLPRTAVVEYNLREIAHGVVRRHLRIGSHDEVTVLELAHGCVSCTLRQDMLPLLRKLASTPEIDRIAVRLDEAMEPEPVCYAIEHVMVGDKMLEEFLQVEAVLTVIDRASWLEQATGDAALTEQNLQASPEDERTLAQVAVAQAEFADVVLCAGTAEDAWTEARTDAVLDRIAPSAPRLEVAGLDLLDALAAVPPDARRGKPTDPHGPLLPGQPPLTSDCGVSTVLFSDPRPFHPERLHDALDVLLDGVVRTRGRAWVASQPDKVLWLESAGGGLGVGDAGKWLAAEDDAWDEVDEHRRAMASLRWHAEFGDRAQDLVVVTHRAATEEIEAALSGALLTDAELAAGPERWASYDDPFGSWQLENDYEETR